MRVGINGFGRIGKTIYKILKENSVNVPLVNDPSMDMTKMLYALKYDSVFGKTNIYKNIDGMVFYDDEAEGTALTDFRNPSDIPWEKYKVDVVIDASGVFKTQKQCEGHKGVKLVIITAPGEDIPMFVYGVNHEDYKGEKIISNASCTTNCLAPLAKIIHEKFEIVEGLMTTVHSVTATQNITDGVGKNLRLSRTGMGNIIPSTTGAAKSIGRVIPSLEGKLNGMSMRVPVINVSVVDLVCKTKKNATMDDIIRAVEEYSITNSNVMGITFDEVVSSDFIKDPRSSIFDVNASMAMGNNMFKLISWYDNEYGYSCRIYDLLKYAYGKIQ